MIISQDLNTDGIIDYAYTVPRPVSGVCANGYISCAPGTWANCGYYLWVSDPSGKISDTGVPIMNLGGCYCINSSCGSSLVWSDSAIILKDLGGGVLAAIQNANFSFTITNVSTTPVTISYYGNVTGDSKTGVAELGSIAATPPLSSLQSYYANTANMNNDLNSTVQSASFNPESLYSEISGMGAGNLTPCMVNRQVSVATQQEFCDQAPFANEVNESIQHTYLKIDTGTRTSVNDCYCGNTLLVDGIGCPGLTATEVATIPAGAQKVGTFAENFFNRIQQSGWDTCSYHVLDYYDLCTRTADTFTESVTDQCTALSNDPSCSLYEETVDSVETVAAGCATGLNPLPSCNIYNGQAGPISLCRPWWAKRRSYLCKTQPAWDFSDAKQRFNAVVGSVSQNGTKLSYSDTTKSPSGTWTAAAGSGTLPATPPQSICELSCKTKTSPGSTQATVTSTVSQLRVAPSGSPDYAYKLCVNNVCPTGPGEVIVMDCQCLADFNQAFTAIQAVRLAGKDIICTSGTLKPVQ
jgi:hypothetical protein